jgi:hypothetical protein
VRNVRSTIFCALAVMGCSSAPPAERHHIVVALTVDWEGAYVSRDGLDELASLRGRLDGAPMTHFVSAAYLTKKTPDPALAPELVAAAARGDEIAMHLHVWSSIARAAGITPKPRPSFLSGTDKIVEFEDGDDGFDTDLDAYDVPALRAMLKVSRLKLEELGIDVSSSFRAGGYIVSANVRKALHMEGYTVDSSAIDANELAMADYLPQRVRAVWPAVIPTAQPFVVEGLVELPIAAVADYTTSARIAAVFDAAAERLKADPSHHVFVTIALHQETAAEYAKRVGDAIDAARVRIGHDAFIFVTVEKAAYLRETDK